MKQETGWVEISVGILIGGVILSGLGYVAMQVNNLNGRVSALEALQRANLEQRVSAIEINIAVIKALTTRVDNLSARVIAINPTSGRIVSPSSGDVVSTVFNYEIELRNPDETKYYYIANRIGGLYWPKARINLQSGVTTYTGTSNEGGSPPGGRFSVVLFEVDTAMHEKISKWLNGTDFPGIQIDGREFASVDVVLRK